jgi:hypothetical protein
MYDVSLGISVYIKRSSAPLELMNSSHNLLTPNTKVQQTQGIIVYICSSFYSMNQVNIQSDHQSFCLHSGEADCHRDFSAISISTGLARVELENQVVQISCFERYE